MKNLILLVTFALVLQFVKGAHHLGPEGSVACNNDHTVNINITNVDDLGEWTTTEWRLQSSDQCEPTFGDGAVNYVNLPLPNCSFSSEQLNGSIKYVLKVIAQKTAGDANGQLRAYDHLYYVTCDYDNQNTSTASFVRSRTGTTTSPVCTAFFTFTLGVFSDAAFNTAVSSPVALNQTLHFKAEVVTQSGAPNLDLFPVECYSSKSDNPDSTVGRFTLIKDGCGNNAESQDLYDTLSYSCSNNTKTETFTIRSFRYFGADAGAFVYIHCDLRVCLADHADSRCECPSVSECDPASRKRRSVGDIVDEEQVYHVVRGPYFYKEEEEEEAEEEEAESDEQDEPQSFSTNLTIIVAVSGVVAIAMMVCGTVYLVVRSRNRRRLHGDLNVVT
ncbi:hypothetical protein OS493_039005 [Desmophyllum pertusum]|uniref:ZP domain-containing protein n=1 Tax=Desmophyllum pertusum TaxID=174260 RepID=A0A9W9YTY9_9CNID|nr:hypothetical protein OS493_039005 [Desmophyllum pertusum]